MPSDLRFGRLPDPDARPVALLFEGVPTDAFEGDTVAAALLAAGHLTFRDSAVSAAPRGPHCMMGACFECLVEIDGAPNRQACMVLVCDGMTVRRMRGARVAGSELADG